MKGSRDPFIIDYLLLNSLTIVGCHFHLYILSEITPHISLRIISKFLNLRFKNNIFYQHDLFSSLINTICMYIILRTNLREKGCNN